MKKAFCTICFDTPASTSNSFDKYAPILNVINGHFNSQKENKEVFNT